VGNIWFTDRDATPAIGRITPSGTITLFSTGLNPGSLPNGIAPGADGNMWFTDQGPTRAIGRITPDGTIAVYTAGLKTGSNPAALTPGPDGNIWFTDQGTTRAIGQVKPDGTITETNSGLNPGSLPGEITPGADGNLWFGDRGTVTKGIGSVTLNATGWTITNYAMAATSLPGGLRTGPDGNLWFTDNGAPQSIGQFGVGAPAASITAPAVAGSGKEGTPHACAGDTWSNWSGQQPSRTAYGFDGYRWLRDGAVIAGQTSPAYTPTADDVGHQLSCTVTVTYMLFPTTVSAASSAVLVREATPPVLTLPSAIVANATGPNGAVVTYAATATDNADPNPVVSCTPASGSTFAVGTTTVDCTATDAAGNTSTGSFTVTVKDASDQLAELAAAVRGVRSKDLAEAVAAAQRSLSHGRIQATCHALAEFVHVAREQSGRKIPTAVANALIVDANRIRAVLGCATPTHEDDDD
jgi:sugar lactone lactonase YvrE